MFISAQGELTRHWEWNMHARARIHACRCGNIVSLSSLLSHLEKLFSFLFFPFFVTSTRTRGEESGGLRERLGVLWCLLALLKCIAACVGVDKQAQFALFLAGDLCRPRVRCRSSAACMHFLSLVRCVFLFFFFISFPLFIA